MNIAISDKLSIGWLKGKRYLNCSDEGEAIGIAGGYYLATGRRANVLMSADGFCNALNPLTSWIIPEGIKINLIISVGRREPQHEVMSDLLEPIIEMLKVHDTTKGISYKLIKA